MRGKNIPLLILAAFCLLLVSCNPALAETLQGAQPTSNDNFHLELRFSKTKFYVGESVTFDVVVYFCTDVESFDLKLPFLNDEAFIIADPKPAESLDYKHYRLRLDQGEVVVAKGIKPFNGRECSTFSFQKMLLATQPSAFEIPASTAVFRVPIDSPRKGRSHSPYDDFFYDASPTTISNEAYKVYTAQTAPIILTAIPLPEEGKPLGFSGCVGRFHIETSANPTEVRLGDPITLTISVRGSDYLQNVNIPPLALSPELEKDFKVPTEMATGTIRDGTKVFTQTLRVSHPEVKAIPPIMFAYFDPDSGEYRTVQSKSIPLQIKPTHIITENEIEKSNGSGSVRSDLEVRFEGIAPNYEGSEVLENQDFDVSYLARSSLWLTASTLPLMAYCFLFGFLKLRHTKHAQREKTRSRKAFKVFKKRVSKLNPQHERVSVDCEELLDCLRSYMEDKLSMNGPSLTFGDIETKLKGQGVSHEITDRLGYIFTICEEQLYGGGIESSLSVKAIVHDTLHCIQSLDRALK
jgi:hypothetical protein